MSFVESIKNALFQKPQKPTPQQVAVNSISKQQVYRSNSDIQRLNSAISAAESVYSPNRDALYRIYKEIDEDPHLTSVAQSRKIKAISKEFRLVSTRGEKAENLTARKYFEGSWFQQCLELIWESVLYGYSLVQIEGTDVDGLVTGVSLVPRRNVKPGDGIWVANPGDTQGTAYADEPWLVGFGKPDDLGLLLKVAKDLLYKKHAKAAQMQFVDIFGMPIRIGKTQSSDPEKLRSLYNSLGNIGSASYGVIDKNDEIQFIETTKGGAQNAYKDFIDYLDSQVSKAIVGQTMTADNGSSKSQAEVHERVADDYSDYDRQLIAFYVNDRLIPKLLCLGLPLQNLRFEWATVEDNTQKCDYALQLMDRGWEIDIAWIADTFDIPVVGRTAPKPAAPPPAAEAAQDEPDKPEAEPTKGEAA